MYQPLDSKAGQIRVARLLPNSDESAIPEVELETVSLEDQPIFEALSYVWGDKTDPTKQILLCGQDFTIRQNLDAILRQFRTDAAGQSVSIWIDAVCINQGDIYEKNQQIPLMGRIYSQASNVRIWLGTSTPRTELAFRHLDYAMKIETYQMLDKATTGGRPQKLQGDFTTINDWLALGELFRTPYWRRRWITQELVLSKSKTIHCGSHVAGPWDNPTLRIGLLVHYADISHNIVSQHIQKYDELVYTAHYESLAILAALNPIAMAQFPSDTRNTVELDLFFQANCLDDKDRVLGIRGLLAEDLDIEPDYNLSISELYAHFAYRYMKCYDSIDLLYLSSDTDGKDLPSWVPDLRRHARESPRAPSLEEWRTGALVDDPKTRKNFSLLTTVAQFFDAASQSTRNLDHPNPSTLVVRGFEVSQIVGIAKLGEQFSQNVLIEWGQLYENLQANGSIPPNKKLQVNAALETFWIGMSKDYNTVNQPFRRSDTQDLERYQMVWKLDIPDYAKAGVTEAEMRTRLYWLRVLDKDTIFFVLADGRIGRAAGNIRVGDNVFVVAGSKLPICLRKMEGQDDEGYSYVGCAYVHGKWSIPSSQRMSEAEF